MLRVLLLLATRAAVASGPSFVDVTGTSGIDAVRGAAPFAVTAGVAVVDWDGDGLPDLFVTGGTGPSALYRNLSGLEFEDVTGLAGLGGLDAGLTGVLAQDFTGDGRIDLLLLVDAGERGVQLHVGRPDGTFTDESPGRLVLPRSHYISLAAADLDGDGDLDVAATRWSLGLPAERGDCLETHLFENRAGVLVWLPDVTVPGCGQVVAFADMDADGAPDLIQANDFGPLFIPNRVLLGEPAGEDGTLGLSPDASAALGLGARVYGMGLAIGDLDGDLIRDMLTTSFGEDALLLGTAGGGAVDVTDPWHAGSALGATSRRFKWGALLLDADNDGDQDLAVAAGWLPDVFGIASGPERAILLENRGGPPLIDVSHAAGLDIEAGGRAFVPADFDLDGRIDLVYAAIDEVRILHNVTEGSGHFIEATLRGTVSNTEAVGAVVTAKACGVTRLREMVGGGIPGCGVAPFVHVGLGSCEGPVELTVRWPSGRVDVHADLPVDRAVALVEPQWLSVTPADAPADGATAVSVHLDRGPGAVGGAVTWSVTAGAPDAQELHLQADGAFRGTLTAPSTPGEARLSFVADGQPLSVHPRVRFHPPEPVTWGLSPANAARGERLRVAARVIDTSGAPIAAPVAIDVVGATVLETEASSAPGTAVVTVLTQDVPEVVVRATLGGAAYGDARPIPLGPAVDAVRSRFRVRPTQGDEGAPVTVEIAPNDVTGMYAAVGKSAPTVTLSHDGELLGVQPKFVFAQGRLVAKTTRGALGGAGRLSARVHGVPLTQTALLSTPDHPPLFALVSLEHSTLRFFDRHLHTGGDITPVFVVLRDADGQDLGDVAPPRVELVGEGCQPLPETWTARGDGQRYYLVDVRVGDTAGTATLRLSLDGIPTGLMTSATIVAASPGAPDAAATTVSAVVTESGARVTIEPRDASGNLLGPGVPVVVSSTSGPASVPTFTPPGTYQALVAMPSKPCTVVVSVSLGADLAPRTVPIDFGGPGACGATARPPVAATAPPPAGATEGCSASPGSRARPGGLVLVLLSLAFAWRSRYAAPVMGPRS